MTARTLNNRQKAAVLFCTFPATGLATLFLFKHGSELVFGLQSRTWGFGMLALQVCLVVALLSLMLKPDTPQS